MRTRLSGALIGVLGLFLLWRATLGVDMSDEAHVVGLARRVAGGAVPFRDEMNIQVLGALPAVPFTWAWLTLVGDSGLVLASRVFYLVLVAVTVAVAAWALREVVSAGVALAVPLIAVLMPAYNILVTSYNTMPLLAMVLATAGAVATLRTRRRRWMLVTTVALVFGTACYPPLLVTTVVILGGLLLLLRDRTLTMHALAAMVVVGLPLLLVFWLVFTPDAIIDTVSSTSGVLGDRLTPSARVRMTLALYWQELPAWRWLPMAAAALVAAVPAVPERVRTVALAAVPLLALTAALLTFSPPTMPSFGLVSAVFLLIVTISLGPATVLLARRSNARPLPVPGGLLLVVLVASAAQAWLTLMTTSSGPLWGVPVLGLVPFIMCVLLILGDRLGTPSGQSVLGVLVLSMALVLGVAPFKSPPPWELTARVTEGPFAGSMATPAVRNVLRENSAAVAAAVPASGTVMFYGSPGGYLLTEAEAVTPMLWLVNVGAAGQDTVDYFERRGERPDVVLLHVGALAPFDDDWDAFAASDPLVAWLEDNYLRDGERAGPYFVLRHR